METSKERIAKRSSIKSYPMNGGEGPYSYANNSSFYQRSGLDIAKTLLQEEIIKKLDINQITCNSTLNSFNIADLGCSVGPNTFFTIQNIIQALTEHKCQSHNIQFQVFFNDHTSNDFNTLFKSLPPERNYFAAGVPGTFYGPLFPKASLHFVHCSYSIQWLSCVPYEVEDESSVAWNKGGILHHGGSKEAGKAFACQFANDMEKFLRARAMELVSGGFMALLLPCLPNGANPSECSVIAIFEVLYSSLMDLAKRGIVDEAKVESFNLPFYFATPGEMESLIRRNGCFKIERMEQFLRPMININRESIEKFAMCMRAGFERVIEEHFGFGCDIIDQLFICYTHKLIQSGLFSNSNYVPMFDLFVFLKRIDE